MIPFAVTPEPNTVVAGWIPVVLIAVLALAMVVLFRSLRKQMRKINIPAEGIPTRDPHAPQRPGQDGENGARPGQTGERAQN